MFPATGNESEPSSSSMQWSQLCRHFEFGQILSVTKNFDESLEIGSGGFGKVYKGSIINGPALVVAAVKRLDVTSDQGPAEFWAEVEMLSKLRHCNLVSLIGYCNHETEMILVYEYMPNGTLNDHLHKLGTNLSWCQRLKICVGAARGLDYLHTGTGIEFGVIHRDVKSSNILLDENWAAKVSDFGLSKITPRNQPSTHVSTLVKGTFGYFDPNYFATGKLTRKSDVYAFGVVMLEVLCRKRAVDDSLDWGLATWAQDSIKEGRLKDIVDSDIRGEISQKCLKEYVRIAEKCLDTHPKHRPTMAEVVITLEYVLALQERTNSLFQTAGKTIFGRMVDKFSFILNDHDSGTDLGSLMVKNTTIGMEFGSLTPKKPRIRMNFGSLLSKKKKQLLLREKFFQQNGALLMEDKLKSGFGSIKVFRAEELEKATMNYAENMIIGRGGNGIVYKGVLPDNRVVAIKRSNIPGQQEIEPFINEILVLGQINHKNVVQLLGCCLETEVPLLAYEYISNHDLYHHLHCNKSNTERLSWDSRLRIAHESASALSYLHSDTTMPIIHRDVKSSNILLDENCTAKVADFGASKSVLLGNDPVRTQIFGTLGYLDPESFHTDRLTDKSDVYSFGVVLAELLTGLKPIDTQRGEENGDLAKYIQKAERENRFAEIVDPQVLEEATNEQQLKAACQVACKCLRMKGEYRPSMRQVTMELEAIRRLSMQPNLWGSLDNYDENSSLMTENVQVNPFDFTFGTTNEISGYSETFTSI